MNCLRFLLLGVVVSAGMVALAMSAWLGGAPGLGPDRALAVSPPTDLTVGLDMVSSSGGASVYSITSLPALEPCVDVKTSVDSFFYVDVFVLNATNLIAFGADLKFTSGKMQIMESKVKHLFGTDTSIYNLSQSVDANGVVTPPVSGGTYYAGALDGGAPNTGSGVLVRFKAQAFLPPSGGQVLDFKISTDPAKGVTLADNTPPPAPNHPGDTNGDGIFDGPFINAQGKVAVDRPDVDNDGISNDCGDNCPNTANGPAQATLPGVGNQTDTDGDGQGDACDDDDDNDGVPDASDNCRIVPNGPAQAGIPGVGNQTDSNGNSVGDACEDSDGDGTLDGLDNCMFDYNPNQSDIDHDGLGDVCDTDDDGDGWADASDNCPTVSNVNQKDWNNDGIGDACQNSDGDFWIDAEDNCPSVVNDNQGDDDQDSRGNVCDNCPTVPNADQKDWNSDGIGDVCQDFYGDGFNDFPEVFITTDPDDACADTTTPNDERGPGFGEPVSPWPVDNNDDRKVNLADILAYIPVYFTSGNPRYDLNASGFINLADILMFIPFFFQSCTP